MATPNLNQLIAAAIGGNLEAELDLPDDVGIHEAGIADVPDAPDADGVEKLASAMEFLGRRGVESFVKTAEHPENNASHHLANTTKKQVGPHAGASPMKPPGFGSIPNNAGKKPGGGKEVDTASHGKGDHHPALKSNESAIAYTKKEKAKNTSGALGAVLDNKAWADPKLKELLDNTDSDKNIHSKSAHDGELIRQALAKKLQEQHGGSDAQ